MENNRLGEFDVSSILTNSQQRMFGRKNNKDVLQELQVDDRFTFDSSQKDGCPSYWKKNTFKNVRFLLGLLDP
jgi:hypothetical protein